jgi:hypothetical protein
MLAQVDWVGVDGSTTSQFPDRYVIQYVEAHNRRLLPPTVMPVF